MTHKCASKLTIIGSDGGLSPSRREAIILTNVEILLIGPLKTKSVKSNSKLIYFIQENAFEIVARNLAAILSRPHSFNAE